MALRIVGVADVTSMLDGFKGNIPKALERGIAKGGKVVVGEARKLCPVSTEKTRPKGDHGELRRSITSQSEGLRCDVGTNKEYGMYVELGTRKMAAQPFLVPALKSKSGEVVKKVIAEFRK